MPTLLRVAACHGLLLSLLMGCAAERVTGIAPQAVPASTTARKLPGKPDAACRFSVKSFADKRPHDGLGRLGPTEVGDEGFLAALTANLAAIPGHVDADAPIELKVELLKAYIQGIGTMKSANVVLRVETTRAGKASQVAVYRGVDNTTNWNNSQSEVQSAFALALNDLREQVQAGIRPLC